MKLVQLVPGLLVCSVLVLSAPALAVESASQVEPSQLKQTHESFKKLYQHRRGGYHGLRGVELTEQQQQELQQLRQTFRQESKSHDRRGEVVAQKQALQALIQADYFDETQARIVLEQQQQAKLERQLAALQWRHAVHQLLTEEQQQQWQQQKHQRTAERGQYRQRKGSSTQ